MYGQMSSHTEIQLPIMLQTLDYRTFTPKA